MTADNKADHQANQRAGHQAGQQADNRIEGMEARIRAAGELAAAFDRDPHRPAYHFTPPAGWMNDINGALYWKGRYHIFYQYNPHGAYWHLIQWGHASSTDLVHWVHHPVALVPDADGPDRKGCYSGCALVSKEGIPVLIYFGNPDGLCLARSSDDLLIEWTKDPGNPVIPQPEAGSADFGRYTIHDPCGWLDNGQYYAAVNKSDPQDRGDAAYLFRSPDLRAWEFVDEFYRSRREWTEGEEDCAVPDFFPLGDRHMLLFCSHLQGSQYYIGRVRDELFYPDVHGRMSWEGGHLGGPRTLLDPGGRRVFFDWVRELRGNERERASGWSGVMTVPRLLSLDPGGNLLIDPVPELEALRLDARRHGPIDIAADAEVAVEGIGGDCLELAVEIDPRQAREVGLKVRRSPGGEEETAVSVDAEAGVLRVDVGRSSLDREIRYGRYRRPRPHLAENEQYVTAQEGPFELAPGEPLILRIFLDRSILEVFANRRQCVTQRIYPTRADCTGVSLFARGGAARMKSLRAWSLAPAGT